jgi:hypothetical protein
MSARFVALREELSAWTRREGVSASVLLELSPPLRRTLQRLLREGSMTVADLGASLALDADESGLIADLMVDCGFVKVQETDAASGDPVVRIVHARQTRADTAAAYWSRILTDSDG